MFSIRAAQVPVAPGSIMPDPVFIDGNVAIYLVEREQLYSHYEEHESHEAIISGLYFEYLRLSCPDGLIQLIVANSIYSMTLPVDRDTVIDQRKELNIFLFDGLNCRFAHIFARFEKCSRLSV